MAKKYRNTYIKPESKDTNRNTNPTLQNKLKERPERSTAEAKSPVLDFLNRYQVRILIGMLSIFAGGFLFVSFVSHIYGTGKADQNIAQNAGLLRILGITPFREYAENWLGIMGAVSAYYFIREWFGYSSFLVAFYSIYFGIKRLKIWTGFSVSIFKYILFSVVWLSCFLSCVLYISTNRWFELGGGLGKALNTAIIRSLGNIGAVLLWLIILGIFLFFNIDLKMILSRKITTPKVKQTPSNTETSQVETEELTVSHQDTIHSNGINPRMKNTSSEVHNNLVIPPTTHKGYQKPSVMVLHSAILGENHVTQTEINTKVIKIIRIMESLGIKVVDVQYITAPSITKFELYPDPSVPISDILQKKADIQKLLLDDNAIVSISANGKDAPIAVQMLNDNRMRINFNNVANTSSFLQSNQALPIALGISENNVPLVIDLAKHQHLLFVGTNTQVERNFHALIVSCLLSKTPQQVKFVFIDTQTTEFTQYHPIQYQFIALLKGSDTPVANTSHKVLNVLRSLVLETKKRLEKLQSEHQKSIEEYNEKHDGSIPYLVVCIYDWGSLYTENKEVENLLHSLLQESHSLGIHLIISIQPKDYDLLSNSIKRYFTTTILHKVDGLLSDKIIGQPIASMLLDDSDTLLYAAGQVIRLECPKVYDSEITNINQTIKSQKIDDIHDSYWLPEYSVSVHQSQAFYTVVENSTSNVNNDALNLPEGLQLSLIVDAIMLITQAQNCEVTFIQKRMRLTSRRVHKLLQYLEKIHVVSSVNADGTRNVLIKDEKDVREIIDKLHSTA
ncbi:MAG: DNA translocase FtsK 4TM domain-containing protein [Bacteroidia bacterium]|nr:DNA translocase FtsK 4TM domain-containing protein [Bacteroidia bacterium]MDW8345466.1 DNA translocase FtsK 4TM domain-containing protein [Bacteroidia bacterium]